VRAEKPPYPPEDPAAARGGRFRGLAGGERLPPTPPKPDAARAATAIHLEQNIGGRRSIDPYGDVDARPFSATPLSPVFRKGYEPSRLHRGGANELQGPAPCWAKPTTPGQRLVTVLVRRNARPPPRPPARSADLPCETSEILESIRVKSAPPGRRRLPATQGAVPYGPRSAVIPAAAMQLGAAPFAWQEDRRRKHFLSGRRKRDQHKESRWRLRRSAVDVAEKFLDCAARYGLAKRTPAQSTPLVPSSWPLQSRATHLSRAPYLCRLIASRRPSR